MAKQEKRPKAEDPEAYDLYRTQQALRSREKSRFGRDISPLPALVDPKRRAACRESFELFARTYFPETFVLAWSNDHRRAIERVECAVLSGGLFAYAMPRGFGKTSIAEAAALWAVLYGYRQFPVVIGSDESAALELLDSVKTELECNEALLDDFPEVCHAIRRLEGLANRANGQLYCGARTHIHWSAKQIVLPSIPGSVASGAMIAVTGITGRIRGMKFKRPSDGHAARPDLVLIDDPQTDESARSPSQSAERVRILCGAVLGLAGPGKKISAVMPCTVIEPGDMADQILDRQKHPEWQGERTKMVYKWPAEIDGLWSQYRKVRADGFRAGDGGKAGTEFYRANRESMDRGAEVAWPVRYNPDELSAIQHAINLRFDRGDHAFFSEYQNDPLPAEAVDADVLTSDAVAGKINGRDRATLPIDVSKVTAFIDVQKAALFWMVCGWQDDFTGYVIDYGVFPKQGRNYFALREIKQTLMAAMKTKSLEAAIYGGLQALTSDLCGRKWQRDDGVELPVERCLIDANWGESSDVVYKFARESAHSALLTPSHGIGVGATSRPFNEYRRKQGDRVGDHWRMPTPAGKRAVRYAVYDTNHWKSFSHARLAVPIGGAGCLSVFGRDPHEHKLLADHLTSESPIPVEARGRRVTEWKLKNMRPDNHLLDCLTGCCVAASIQGVSLEERKAAAARPVKRVRFSELQNRAR